MNKLVCLAALILVAISAHAGTLDKSCQVLECSPGDKAVTYASQSEMYWACPTRELAEYTDTLLGMVAITYQLTGKLPNISPVTGEAEFEGDTERLIEAKRNAAHVGSFDEAIAQCHKGRAGIRVSIMNNPGKGAAIWVQNDKTNETFWMSAGMLDKR